MTGSNSPDRLSAMDEIKTLTPEEFFNGALFRNVKKMPALFVIDRVKHMGTEEINPAAAWVFTEPAKVTAKKDGTGVTVTEDGEVFVRRSVKAGKKAPAGFRLAEHDDFTGHSFGMEPVEQSGFAKMFREAMTHHDGQLEPGTYELVGPKINGNPEKLAHHTLLRHGDDEITEIPDLRTINPADAFEILKKIFTDFLERGIEGVVWAGADNKRVKLRTKDFFGDPNRW